jgi:hypothetical protein
MSRRIHSLLAVLGGSLLVAGMLSGCASGEAGGVPTPPATPGNDGTAEIAAAWLDGGAMVGVLLEGSSTCRPFADDVTYDDGVLRVSIMEPEGVCAHDLVPQGLAVALPAGVDAAQDLRVEVVGTEFRGETDLAGVAGLTPGTGIDGSQPSAGWAGPDVFALLTWGSSSCQPQVETAAVGAAGEISVTFVTPPGDRVCTFDMAPRVTAVEVPGVPAGAAYEAVLSGDAYDGARVPIAGQP